MQLNEEMCDRGLKLGQNSLLSIIPIVIGLFILGLTVFLSENVIKGLYEQENQFVKTNKLRYDWN